MQLFKVGTNDQLTVEGEVAPKRLKDWTVGGQAGREEHIEELLVRHPGLLNFDAFDLDNSSNDEVLIVSQQPIASNRKRADLLGVHRDGSLVVIEIKRDAEDASHRTESLEFQALRYAAASRRMTAFDVVSLFKNYLRKREATEDTGQFGDSHWRLLAVKRLGEHLGEEGEEMTEDELTSIINPRKKQKIYLVAASYEGDATAACAWLREHGIDISAFRLRPYTIAGEPILERERLIPPPELDEFMSETFAVGAPASEASTVTPATRAPIDKLREVTWSDREEPERMRNNNWNTLLEHVVTRVLKEGMPPAQLPTKWHPDDNSGMIASKWIPILSESPDSENGGEQSGIHVELFGGAEQIRNMVNIILQRWEVSVTLLVETQRGNSYEFPHSP